MFAMFLMAAAPATTVDEQLQAANIAYRQCVLAAAEKLAVISTEPAPVIADGALGECVSFEADVEDKISRVGTSFSWERIDNVVNRIRRRLKERAIAAVINLRAKKR